MKPLDPTLMKRLAKLTAVAALLLSTPAAAVSVLAQSAAPAAPVAADWSREHSPDTLLVRFKQTKTLSARAATHAKVGAKRLTSFWVAPIDVVRIPPGARPEQTAAAYAAMPDVAWVEPNYVAYADGIPNDPSFSLLYGLNNTGQSGGTPGADIDAPEAWEQEQGSSAVVVAVVDSGIDYNHPDLRENMWTNTPELDGSAGVDDDGNGIVDDVHGARWSSGSGAPTSGDPMDDNFHGTHVAGTIGARGGNGIGVVGVNHRVRLMALKWLGADGRGFIADAIGALQYSVAKGVPISNNSWGADNPSQALRNAIDAVGAAGQLFVASAGNDGRNIDAAPRYPAAYDAPHLISVGNSTDRDQLAPSSNFGAVGVDLLAPGTNIYSTFPFGSYAYLTGTSMAAPHVAGAAALLLARSPSASAVELKQAILATVDPVPAASGVTVTGGRLNLARALGVAGPTDHLTEIFGDDNGSFDLANRSLTFTPDGSSNFYRLCTEPASRFPVDPAAGTPLSLSDDSFVPVALENGAQVGFFGTSHSAFWVGSNGYLTFVQSDASYASTPAAHFAKSRLSALMTDLNPGAGGRVSWQQLQDRVAVTFESVPQYGSEARNSFQFELFFDGRIRVTYLALESTSGVAGVSRGSGLPAGFVESDLSAATACMAVTVSLPRDARVARNAFFGPVSIGLQAPAGLSRLEFEVAYDPAVVSAGSFLRTQTDCSVTASAVAAGLHRLVVVCPSGYGGAEELGRLFFRALGSCRASSPLTVRSCSVEPAGTECRGLDGRLEVDCSFTGRAIYYAGTGGVPAAMVKLSGAADASLTTDEDGIYRVVDIGAGPLRIEPAKQGDFQAGISALDAAYVLQHVIGSRTLDENQVLACDVTGNGSVSALDAAKILQFVTGRVSRFAVAEQCGSDWAFAPRGVAPPGASLEMPRFEDGQCRRGAVVWEDYAGAVMPAFNSALYGDCTGNWLPHGGSASLSAVAAQGGERRPELRVSRLRRRGGGRLQLYVSVKAPGQFRAATVQLAYNPEHMRLVEVRTSPRAGGAAISVNDTVPGFVALALASGVDLPKSVGGLFVLEFEPTADRVPRQMQALSGQVDEQAAVLRQAR